MWIYEIGTGRMFQDINGEVRFRFRGYAGDAEHRDNPKSQALKGQGPLPVGVYRMGKSYDSDHLGPVVIPLIPIVGMDTFGRDAFRIHPDSVRRPGDASHGCICLAREHREDMASSTDKLLAVVSYFGGDNVRYSGGVAI